MTTTATPTGPAWRFVRLTAPLVAFFAGRRFFPVWAIVQHRGRRTGRELSVPVAVTATAGTFLIALPWGPDTNWARNVIAAGGCVIRWKGADHHVSGPELLTAAQARPRMDRIGWLISQRVFHARSFLLLRSQ